MRKAGALSAIGTKSPPYRLTPRQLADDWLSRSCWDAAFYACMAGLVAFAMAMAFGSGRDRHQASQTP